MWGEGSSVVSNGLDMDRPGGEPERPRETQSLAGARWCPHPAACMQRANSTVFGLPTQSFLAPDASVTAADGVVPSADASSKPLLVCAETGQSYRVQDLDYRVTMLARSLAQRLGWQATEGPPGTKVVGILALNAVGQT